MAAPGFSPPAQAAPPGVLVCDSAPGTWYTGGTYTSVRVPQGASCYLRNAVVTGNFTALHGSGDVLIINTEVQRNIHIRGSEGNVRIGPPGCGFDPLVGNNVMVTDSHNVAICFTNAHNNIRVSGNDGRISLFNNQAGNNISVVDNPNYVAQPGDGDHGAIDAIRLRNNVAGNHIVVRRNADRPLRASGNTPTPITD